jgi:PST family polysaccharide transporter
MARFRTVAHISSGAEAQRDLRSRSVRAVGLTGAAGFVDLALRLASTIVLARLLLPEHFGVVTMVTAVTGIADQLRDLGLSTATVQKQEITDAEVSNLFWINTAAGFLVTVVLCALSPLVSAYYRDQRLTIITCVLATNFLLNGLIVQHQALLARSLRLGATATVRLISSIVSVALAVALARGGFGYWSLVWREVARSLVLMGGMWICLPWVPALPSWRTNVRGLLRFGTHLSVANVVINVGSGADRFLLGRLWGAGAVGLYRQAYQVLLVPLDQLLSPAFQVTQPGLSLLQSEPDRYVKFYRKYLNFVCVVTMPLSIFVAVYANEIVRALLGVKWIDCVPVLIVLCIGGFPRNAVQSSSIVLITRGDSRTYLRFILANNIVFVILMAIGVRWGILGVAVATAGAEWLMSWPRLRYSLGGSPVSIGEFLRTAARPAGASIAMGAVLLITRVWTSHAAPIVAVGVGCMAAALSFALAWLLVPGGKSEVLGMIADVRSALPSRRADASAATF